MQHYFVGWTGLDTAFLHTTECRKIAMRDAEYVRNHQITAREFLNKFSSFSDTKLGASDLAAYERDPESLIRAAVDEASGYVTIHKCAVEKFERDMDALIDEHAGLA